MKKRLFLFLPNVKSPISHVCLESSLFEERHELIDTEVGEDLAMPIHGRGFGLTRQRDHFAHRLGVAGDDHDAGFNALAREIVDDLVAPRAARLDVENGEAHGR